MLNDEQLLSVRKPGQYVGGEWNVSRKDINRAALKVALCFPDLYEVGMSNLGLRILYGILNRQNDVACERFFAPAVDMEAVLRQAGLPLFSLESGQPMRDFDIVGFSLAYELTFTNVLNMLSLAGIPFESSRRPEGFPLVIAGGPCACNPEPMADFFDLFVIGEAEEAILEVVCAVRDWKERKTRDKLTKHDLLVACAGIPGVYVPSFYEVTYHPDGTVRSCLPTIPQAPARVVKRFVRDLDTAFFPVEWLVPCVQIVHDRLTVEVMRGCPNQCRFCQARTQYYPLRMRKVQTVLDLTDALYRASGYEEIALTGLSVSDYPHLADLVRPLIERFKAKGIGVSLPSIKPRIMLKELVDVISTIKKTGLTFAPEAASGRLRQLLGKRFDEAEFFSVLSDAFDAGYQHLKLYFMIGLPFERQEDVDAIAGFSRKVSELRRARCGRPAQVNISVNALIPKPHTPLQWFAMADPQQIKAKQDQLRLAIRNRNLRVAFHDRFMSFLEGIFARGDRRLSAVIRKAFESGCRFDGWQEHFMFERWMQAFQECGCQTSLYTAARTPEQVLPWDHLDMGISRDELIREYQAIMRDGHDAA